MKVAPWFPSLLLCVAKAMEREDTPQEDLLRRHDLDFTEVFKYCQKTFTFCLYYLLP
jgi:hypothetical protein